MKLFHSIEENILAPHPAILAIGNFDGVHLGHQAVLKRCRQLAQENNQPFAVISFENHPSEILRPNQRTQFLCTIPHKINLLEKAGVNILILLRFSKELSELTAEAFLKKVQRALPYSHLILGYDAVLGKDRQGTPDTMQKMAKMMQIEVEYVKAYDVQQQVVSSSKIRQLIQQGAIEEASLLLGRPYSIYASVVRGAQLGKKIGYPTVNLNVSELCLPPLGVYAIELIYQGKKIQGVANLGMAPTVRHDQQIILEAHLFNFNELLYDQAVEIIFRDYIRPEKKFKDISELKKEISQDIQAAKIFFDSHLML